MIPKQSSLNVETGIKITESEQRRALSFSNLMNGWYISYEKFDILYNGVLNNMQNIQIYCTKILSKLKGKKKKEQNRNEFTLWFLHYCK